MTLVCGALPLLRSSSSLFAGAYAIAAAGGRARPLEASGSRWLVAAVPRWAPRRGAARADGGACSLFAALARPSTIRSPPRTIRGRTRVIWRAVRPPLRRRRAAGSGIGAFNHWEMAGDHISAPLATLLAGVGLGARASATADAVGARGRRAPRRSCWRSAMARAAPRLLLSRRAALRRAALSDAGAGDGRARAAALGRRSRRSPGDRGQPPRALARRCLTALGGGRALSVAPAIFVHLGFAGRRRGGSLRHPDRSALRSCSRAIAFALLHPRRRRGWRWPVCSAAGRFRIVTGARRSRLRWCSVARRFDLLASTAPSCSRSRRDYAVGIERFAAVDWPLGDSTLQPVTALSPDRRGPFRLHNLGMTYDLPRRAGATSRSPSGATYEPSTGPSTTGTPMPVGQAEARSGGR